MIIIGNKTFDDNEATDDGAKMMLVTDHDEL